MQPVEIEFLMKDGLSGGIDSARKKSDLLDASLKRIAATIGVAFTAREAVRFGKALVDVHADMQMMEKSFEVLTGSAEKAKDVFSKLKDYAVISPLTLQTVSDGAQLLMGYNIESEQAIKTVKQLGDVTMGNAAKFQSMVLAFSQMFSAGQVLSQDIRQMATAGFNPLVEIARTTGKTLREVQQAMHDEKPTTAEVAKAFETATSAGGRFYKMSEKQAEGIAGLKASLADAIQTAMNEFGEKQEGIIAGGYKMATSLVRNYETTGKVLAELIITYGAYKAAVIVATEVERGYTVAQALHLRGLTALERAQKMLNKTMLNNPYVAVTMAVVALGLAFYKLATYQTDAQKAQSRLNAAAKEFDKSAASEESALARLKGELSAATKGSDEYNRIKGKIINNYGKYHDGLADEIEKVGFLEDTYNNLTKAIQASFGARQYESFIQGEQNLLDDVTSEKLGKIQDKLIDKLGDDAGSRYYAKIRDAVFNAKEIDAETQAVLDKISGKADNKNFQNRSIDFLIQDIKEAEKRFEAIKAKAQNRFGVTNTAQTQTPTPTPTPAPVNGANELTKTEKERLLREAQEKADTTQKLIKLDNQAALERRKNTLENEQKELDAEKDGFAKKQKQIALNHEQELLSIDAYAQELIAKQQEIERLNWENSGKKGVFTPATATEAQLPQEQQDVLSAARTTADATQTAENQKLIETLAAQYQDYSQRRLKIEKQFSADLAAMYDGNGNLLTGISQASVNELQRQWTEALANLDNEFSHTKTAIETLFGDMAQKTPAQMRAIAKQAQEMVEFVTDGKWDSGKADAYGIKTEAQFKQLNAEWAKSPEKLAAINKEVKALNNTADKSETAFKKMAAGLKQVFSAGGQTDLESGLDALSEGLQSVTEMADMFSNSLKNIGEISGNETFGQIADGLSSVMDVANSTMEGAEAGAAFGPVGAAIGAALGLISSITDALAAGKAQAEKNARLTAEAIRTQYIAEKEVNRLYRERYEWSQKIGETNLAYTRRMGEDLAKQHAEASRDAEDYWEKLQGSEYKNYWDNGKRYGIFGDRSAKDVDAGYVVNHTDRTGSDIDGDGYLAGKTEKQIEEWYLAGRLTEEAKEYYEAWKQAKEEREKFMQQELEEAERLREMVTGTTFSGIADSIVEGFKAGKRSAADFADTFEDLMRNAVSAALSVSANDKLRQWYEDFAAASDGDKDGINDLTQEEIAYLKQKYIDITGELNRERQDIEAATGVSVQENASQSGRAGAYETASQESITRLEGLYSSMLEHEIGIDNGVGNIAESMNTALVHLQQIEENTAFCRRLNDIADDINAIKRDGIRTR